MGLFSKVIKNGRGECGRMIEISKNREVIKDFQFHKEITFGHVFRECIYYSISHDRKEVTLVKGFLPSLSIKKRCATHFRLFLGGVAFSDFIYDETTAAYKPVCPAIHESFSVSFGACIPISKACNDIVITSGLAIDGAIDVSVGIVVVVGIDFFKEENGIMYHLPSRSCMKIGEVF